MFFSLQDVLFILEQYRYWLIFPVMILEGPVITIISGFLVRIGILNIYIAYLLLVIADLTGDVLHYAIGRYWQESLWAKKYGRFFGYNDKSEKFLEDHFRKHRIKTLVFAKLSQGIGTGVQIAAGIAKANFFEYLWINLAGTIPKTLVFFLIGFYMGDSYQRADEYMNSAYLITISIVILIILYIISNRFVKNYFNKNKSVE